MEIGACACLPHCWRRLHGSFSCRWAQICKGTNDPNAPIQETHCTVYLRHQPLLWRCLYPIDHRTSPVPSGNILLTIVHLPHPLISHNPCSQGCKRRLSYYVWSSSYCRSGVYLCCCCSNRICNGDTKLLQALVRNCANVSMCITCANAIPSLIAGTALSTLGIGLLSMLNDTMPFGQLYGFIIIAGAGAGMIYACSNVAAQSACEPKDLGKCQLNTHCLGSD